MKIINKVLVILIFWIGSNPIAFGQRGGSMKSILSIENQYLIAKIDNPIRIVAQQNEPVTISQLNATFQGYDSEKEPIEIVEGKGYFIINPDSIGIVEIHVTIGDTVEIKKLGVKPIEAVGRLGIHKANSDTKIGVGEFKAQMGIIANIECCGFDARCSVLGFQTI